jgi:hypothetical protein
MHPGFTAKVFREQKTVILQKIWYTYFLGSSFYEENVLYSARYIILFKGLHRFKLDNQQGMGALFFLSSTNVKYSCPEVCKCCLKNIQYIVQWLSTSELRTELRVSMKCSSTCSQVSHCI